MGTKSYIDFLDELSDDELFERLVGHGLFADKLPPAFTSENFLTFCQSSPESVFPKKEFGFIEYQNMRNINVPRVLAIPNPVAYRNYCKAIADNWDQIKKHFRTKTSNWKHRISRIHIRKLVSKKSLFEMSYKNFSIDDSPEEDIIIGKRFLVKADIANCFGSIYSHSIPWSLIGIKAAKKKRKGGWYNKLDERNCQQKRGETQGILIGPHASNITSEIVLCTVDFDLCSKGYDYVRKIDDYHCYVSTFEQGEQFLLDLASELRKYGLSLNHKKTRILELPIASVEHWVRKLNQYVFKNTEKADFKDVQAYLDLAIELMHRNNDNTAILNYAIKVLSEKALSPNAKKYLFKTCRHLVLIYPYLLCIVEEQIIKSFSISQRDIKDFSIDIWEMGLNNNLFEAMSYSLYFSLEYDFCLDINLSELFNTCKKSQDCVLLVLGYLYQKKHSGSVCKYTLLAKAFSKDDTDMDKFWLFVYEVLPESALKDYWKSMKRNSVSFINV